MSVAAPGSGCGTASLIAVMGSLIDSPSKGIAAEFPEVLAPASIIVGSSPVHIRAIPPNSQPSPTKGLRELWDH
jgi:hypothetical protein